MAVLEMKGICYAYEKGRPILSDINTEFEVGKMYAVLDRPVPARQLCCH